MTTSMEAQPTSMPRTGVGEEQRGARSVTAAPVRMTARPRVRRRTRSRLGTVVPPLVAALILLGAWQLYVDAAHIDVAVLPSPIRVATQGWDNRGDLWSNTVPTLEETLIGFALSMAVAWLFAVVCDFWTLVRRGLEPLLVASQTVPVIAIAPLFIIWFGFGVLPKALIVALVTFFPVTVSLLQGFGTTPAEATNLLRSMGAGPWQRFVRVRVPTALPFFFSGVRIAITYAVVGAIFGEYVGAYKGLGIYMETTKNARRTDLVLAAVVVTAILSLALYMIVTAIERVAIPWSRTARSEGRRR
jgi:ABC-type nitrate/sulfonate/bicarbonate transport system permease component